MRRFLISILAVGLALCQPAAFAQSLHVIESPNLHCNDTVAVYSPQGAGMDLPTLFLLHGWSGSHKDWGKNTDLQAISDEYGFRIICPDGFKDSWYMDKVDSTQMKWRTFFWEELWPLMDETYGLLEDRTFIDGLSMGGHGAMNIFLDRPDLFRGAGSMSGVLNLRHSGGSKVLIPPMLGVESIEDPVCDAQSAVNRVERLLEICGPSAKMGGENAKTIVVSCGSIDKTFLPATQEFAARCNELGIACIELYSPARHRWPYWVWVLPYHLSWFKEAVEGSAQGFTNR